MNGSQRKTQFEQGQVINIILDYALNSNYSGSVSMYCAYLVLSELQLNSNIVNPRHAGKVDDEHPIRNAQVLRSDQKSKTQNKRFS